MLRLLRFLAGSCLVLFLLLVGVLLGQWQKADFALTWIMAGLPEMLK